MKALDVYGIIILIKRVSNILGKISEKNEPIC